MKTIMPSIGTFQLESDLNQIGQTRQPRQSLTTRQIELNPVNEGSSYSAYESTILECISDAVIVTNCDFRISSWNRGAEKLYGITSELVIGNYLADIIHYEYVKGTREDARAALIATGSWEGEVTHERSGKKIRLWAKVTEVRNDTGKLVGYVAVNREIGIDKHYTNADDLANIEKQFEVFMNRLSGLSWIVDDSGIFHFMNDDYRSCFNFTGEDLGKSISELFPKQIAEEYLKNNERVFEFGETVKTLEHGIGPCGDKILYKIQKFPLYSQGGRKYLGGIAVDITNELSAVENVARNIFKNLVDEQEVVKSNLTYQLHEEVNQLLSASKMLLNTGSDFNDADLLTKSSENLETAIQQIREICKNLSPHTIEYVGLKASVREMIHTLLPDYIQVSTQFPTTKHMPSGKLQLISFRIIQEYIQSLFADCEFSELNVRMRAGNKALFISIADNSKDGKDRNEKLTLIKSLTYFLGGHFRIDRYDDGGRCFRLLLPIKDLEGRM